MPEEFDPNKVAAEFINQHIDAFLSLSRGLFKSTADQLRLRLDRTYKSYISCLLNRHSKAKSFFIRADPVYLYEFYVPLAVHLRRKRLDRPDIKSLCNVSPHVVITGTAGSGKTMFMRHLFLTCVLSKVKVPIFVELRQLNQRDESLRETIQRGLKSCRFQLGEAYIESALKSGHFAVFLDGFDEVAQRKRAALTSAILEFANDYGSNWLIVSSRPEAEIHGWQQFTVAELEPLTLDRACELVEKLPFDDEMKQKFLDDLKWTLFETHESFLSNPLLLSIMLLTYRQSAHIPDKLNVFYGHAYEALFQRHDALKSGFQRERRTSLDVQDFAKVFSTFCLHTYDKTQTEFTQSIALEYLEKCKSIAQLKFDSADYVKDMLQAVCLLVEDGLSLTFAHRSFQEYFTARYIADAPPNVQQALIEKYSSRVRYDSVMKLLYEMRPDVVEIYYVIPRIDTLLRALGVNKHIGLTHYVKYLKNNFSYFILDREGPGIEGSQRSDDALTSLISFTIWNCGHLVGWPAIRTSGVFRRGLQKR